MFYLAFIVGVASYIQANFGFSFTLIAVALVVALGLSDLHTITAVVSFLVVFNSSIALATSSVQLSWRIFFPTAVSMVPALGLGVYLLYAIPPSSADLLQLALGVCVTAVGAVFGLSTANRKQTMLSRPRLSFAGATSGVLGGLFGAAGPPLVYELYRQKVSVHVIKKTLLGLLLVFGVFRSSFVVLEGGISTDVMLITAKCLPAAIIGAWVGNKLLLPIKDDARETIAMLLLIPIGLMLIVGSIWS